MDLQAPNQQPPKRFDAAVIAPIIILVLATLTMIVPMVFGVEILGVKGSAGVASVLGAFAESPNAPVIAVALFTLLGLTGFPQFMIILAAAAIFGSLLGFVLSWTATMVSALIGFWIGRISGGSLVRRYGGKTVLRVSQILGRRGIAASAIVRLIPSGPAIMVNMIAGASHMKWWQFAIGTGLGSIPKAALFAFFGGHIGDFLRGRDPIDLVIRDPIDLVIAALALLASVLLGLWLRKRFLKDDDDEDDDKSA